ncbi:LOW QUALITY PROTEIN: hypothetical protein U9M48_016875 [Paspalum notatum var. saurae]|uniref:Uncharacterized protein n=1 Tax=Paspalum notatum var. saurae TaxID=547442 RepID=A0AAQ3T8J9_PASNO
MEIRAPPTSLRLAPPPASASFRRTALRTPFLNGSEYAAAPYHMLRHIIAIFSRCKSGIAAVNQGLVAIM